MENISTFMPWIWLGILILCIVIEAVTFSLTTIWAGIASFPMIFISRTSLELKWQLLIFALITVFLVIFTRPFAIKKLKNGSDKTNVNSLIGQEVLVVKSISAFSKGEVKSKNGVLWSALSTDETEITENSICTVDSVDGNTLKISLKK